MKRFDLKNLIWIFFILFMAACQDETDSRLNVEEGLPAKLALSIQVPEVDDITVTRAITNNESQIKKLVLFFYSQNSDLSYGVDLSSMLSEGTSDGNGHRTYGLTGNIDVKTGTFRVYAVANWSSDFAGVSLNASDVPDESSLKSMMANNRGVYVLGVDEYLPMSEVLSDQTFYAEGEGTNKLTLSLKRATARIEFTIKNGENLEGTFTPQSYQIYNLPSSSYLFEQDNNIVSNLGTFNTEPVSFENGATTFEFLMNENVRPVGIDITNYTDRDKYNSSWMDHNFTNAPESSTYVVINGRYESSEKSGDVHYLVHLGNFSSKDGSVDNFTVNRNELHKYTVTVDGVDNISTDVEVKNPGAYGNIDVFQLAFTSEPAIQDAHYVIYPIHIQARNVPGDSWTVTSDNQDVTLRTELTTLTRRGFWIEEDKGETSITSEAEGDDITIYAFLAENAGEENRNITLTLKPTNGSDIQARTFTFSQLCPSWNGNLGCERIEEYDEGFTGYPWGFMWEEGLQIKYDFGNWIFGGYTFESLVLSIYLGLFNDNPWVSGDTEWSGLNAHYVVTFDFDEISTLNVATDSNNGILNTSQLYNFDGINDASSMMQMIEEWGISPDQTLPSNPTEFAARTCALKNKFNKVVEYENGEPVERAVLNAENLVWYLPAQNEASNMKDDGTYTALSGDYWTSTAIDDNQNAYKYIVGSSTSSELRRTPLKVRAVRQKSAN